MGVLDSLTTALGGGAIGIGVQAINNVMGLNQNDDLLQQQIQANEQMSTFNENLNEKYWNDTNSEAQVAHLEDAGLNPALMYAKGGAGGSTMNSGMAVNASAPQQQNIGAGIQMAQNAQALSQQQDQINNQKKVQDAQASNLDASTGNLQVDNDIKKVQLAASNIDYDIKDATKEEVISRVQLFNRKLQNDIDLGTNQIGVNKDTYQAQVEKIRNDAANSAIQGILMNKQITGIESQIEVNNQKIKESIANIAQGWNKLQIDQQNANSNSLNSTSQSQTAQVNSDRLKWEKQMHDVADSTKMSYDAVKFAVTTAANILNPKTSIYNYY